MTEDEVENIYDEIEIDDLDYDDSDGWVTPGNIPFFLKEDFEGVILKNTPVAQIFPYQELL